MCRPANMVGPTTTVKLQAITNSQTSKTWSVRRATLQGYTQALTNSQTSKTWSVRRATVQRHLRGYVYRSGGSATDRTSKRQLHGYVYRSGGSATARTEMRHFGEWPHKGITLRQRKRQHLTDFVSLVLTRDYEIGILGFSSPRQHRQSIL